MQAGNKSQLQALLSKKRRWEGEGKEDQAGEVAVISMHLESTHEENRGGLTKYRELGQMGPFLCQPRLKFELLNVGLRKVFYRLWVV